MPDEDKNKIIEKTKKIISLVFWDYFNLPYYYDLFDKQFNDINSPYYSEQDCYQLIKSDPNYPLLKEFLKEKVPQGNSIFFDIQIKKHSRKNFYFGARNESLIKTVCKKLPEKYEYIESTINEDQKYKIDLFIKDNNTNKISPIQIKNRYRKISKEEDYLGYVEKGDIKKSENYIKSLNNEGNYHIRPTYIFVDFNKDYNSNRFLHIRRFDGKWKSFKFNSYLRGQTDIEKFEKSVIPFIFEEVYLRF